MKLSDKIVYSEKDDILTTFDTHLYNLLLDYKKSNDPLLKMFKIYYPENYAQTHINAVYVGRTQTTPREDLTTFDMDRYECTIELIVTTKKYEKMERRRLLKTMCYHIIDIIKSSTLDSLVEHIDFTFEYDNTNVLNQARIVIRAVESFGKESKEKEFKRVCKMLYELETVEYELKHNKKKINGDE